MEDVLINCKSCKNQVAMADLKADKSGSGWICFKCYKHQHPEVYKEGTEETKSPELKQPSPPETKVKYQCTECSYKLTKEPGYRGKCPYCNTYSIKQEKDADSFIRDVIGTVNSEKPQEEDPNKIEIIE